jgi:hypothetical protein
VWSGAVGQNSETTPMIFDRDCCFSLPDGGGIWRPISRAIRRHLLRAMVINELSPEKGSLQS